MPRGNRTGPNGQGPMTGRGMGYCRGNDAPGFTTSNCGRGFGRGLGFQAQGTRRGFRHSGRGFRAGYSYRAPVYAPQEYAPQELSKEEEKQMLEADLKDLDAEKKDLETEKLELERRLKEISE